MSKGQKQLFVVKKAATEVKDTTEPHLKSQMTKPQEPLQATHSKLESEDEDALKEDATGVKNKFEDFFQNVMREVSKWKKIAKEAQEKHKESDHLLQLERAKTEQVEELLKKEQSDRVKIEEVLNVEKAELERRVQELEEKLEAERRRESEIEVDGIQKLEQKLQADEKWVQELEEKLQAGRNQYLHDFI